MNQEFQVKLRYKVDITVEMNRVRDEIKELCSEMSRLTKENEVILNGII